MKTPRVSDFDPNAPVPKLKSSMEDFPPIEKPKQGNNEANVTPVPPVRAVPPVPPTQSTKRVMKQRHPFDIYQDQYESLQKLAREERMQGGIGSMSAMVREAIDKLIVEKKGK